MTTDIELNIDLPDPAKRKRHHPDTPARVGAGQVGARPYTGDALLFSADHAVTQDAIMRPVDPDLLVEMKLLQVKSRAETRQQYLRRPDLGRLLDEAAIATLHDRLIMQPDVQIFVGDGLSAAAVEHNLPILLPELTLALTRAGLSVGRPFFVHNARVGLLNAVNEIVDAKVCVMLIGERPGLARAESMSIYLGYRPKPTSTDAQRNVISNIYHNGLPPLVAVQQAVALINRMLSQQVSGVGLTTYTIIPAIVKIASAT